MPLLPSIFQRYTDNLLIGASVETTPAPSTTYDADTLLLQQPGSRVLFPSGSVSMQFTTGGGSPSPTGRADLLVIPVWNVDAGSAVARISCAAGMDVAIEVPAMMPSGIPRTTAVDLSVLEPDAAKRTDSVFTIDVTSNSANLIMGGAVLLYGPKRTFTDRDWHWGFTRGQEGKNIVHENDHGTDLVYPRRTMKRHTVLQTLATDDEAEDLELWADANFGNGLPGFLWPVPDKYPGRAMFGRLESVNTQQTEYDDAVSMAITFSEISKGKPVA